MANSDYDFGRFPDLYSNYIFAPPAGEWYRVIEYTPIKLVLSRDGIEIPNAQCAYIHQQQFEITEKQAKQYHDLHIDWKTARDNNIAANIDDTMPTVSFLGFDIYTEDNQINQYWYDYQSSMHNVLTVRQTHYIMKRLK